MMKRFESFILDCFYFELDIVCCGQITSLLQIT